MIIISSYLRRSCPTQQDVQNPSGGHTCPSSSVFLPSLLSFIPLMWKSRRSKSGYWDRFQRLHLLFCTELCKSLEPPFISSDLTFKMSLSKPHLKHLRIFFILTFTPVLVLWLFINGSSRKGAVTQIMFFFYYYYLHTAENLAESKIHKCVPSMKTLLTDFAKTCLNSIVMRWIILFHFIQSCLITW